VYKRSLEAITRFQRCELDSFLKCIFLGRFEHFDQENPRPVIQDSDFRQPLLRTRLNDNQKACVIQTLRQRFTIIHGPPGTGKTTTIAVLVYNMIHCVDVLKWVFIPTNLKQGAAIAKPQVLVCAATNTAVKLLAQRIHETGAKVVRVPSENQRRQGALENDPLSSFQQALENKGKGSIMEKEISAIRAAQVVCATCGMLGSSYFKKLHFPAVVIDEAAQCTDPEILAAVAMDESR
jgi:regulator of nonsense transcripts 1